jgi:hypothetical protein
VHINEAQEFHKTKAFGFDPKAIEELKLYLREKDLILEPHCHSIYLVVRKTIHADDR